MPRRTTRIATCRAVVVADGALFAFVERKALHGLGSGYVDAQLLAATRLTPDAQLWTADRRQAGATSGLDLLISPSPL